MRRNNRRRRSTKSVNYEQDGGMEQTGSVAAAMTLANIANIEEVKSALNSLLDLKTEECWDVKMDGSLEVFPLITFISVDEEMTSSALTLLSISSAEAMDGGALGGVPQASYGKKPWTNDVEGAWVRIWHLILKKASDISIATAGLSFPSAVGAATFSACALSFSYLDAVFVTALYILLGGVQGAWLSWFGSITLTAAAYVAIKTFVKTYIQNDSSAAADQEQFINPAAQMDQNIHDGFADAWISTRAIVPDIWETLAEGWGSASDILADIMVTRLIRKRYIWVDRATGVESERGLDANDCKGEDSRGTLHKLFGSGAEGELLNSAITVSNAAQLPQRKAHRTKIFATKELVRNIGKIIYNIKAEQDETRAEGTEAAAAAAAAAAVSASGSPAEEAAAASAALLALQAPPTDEDEQVPLSRASSAPATRTTTRTTSQSNRHRPF